MPRTIPRILAIDPGTRYMGVAVVEAGALIYYTVKDLRDKRPVGGLLRATREIMGRLIDDYRPDVLAYEQSFYVQSRASRLLRGQEAEIRRVARERGLRLVGYNPMTVRRRLCGDGWARKREVAGRLTERYPELGRYLGPPGTRRERYWQHVFDALAVGIVCLEDLTRACRARRVRSGRE